MDVKRWTLHQTCISHAHVKERIKVENCSYTLVENLMTSHQVDYLPSAIIPAEAIEMTKMIF